MPVLLLLYVSYMHSYVNVGRWQTTPIHPRIIQKKKLTNAASERTKQQQTVPV